MLLPCALELGLRLVESTLQGVSGLPRSPQLYFELRDTGLGLTDVLSSAAELAPDGLQRGARLVGCRSERLDFIEQTLALILRSSRLSLGGLRLFTGAVSLFLRLIMNESVLRRPSLSA